MEKLEHFLAIEEDLKAEFQKMCLVSVNFPSDFFGMKKAIHLYEMIQKEKEELKLSSLTSIELNTLLSSLLIKGYDLSFDSFWEEPQDINQDSWHRLTQQLKIEWFQRNYKTYLKMEESEEKEVFYDQIFQSQLMQHYFQVCALLSRKMRKSYFATYYEFLYLFPDMNHGNNYQDDFLNDPFLEKSFYFLFAKQWLETFFEDMLFVFQKISLKQMQRQFSNNRFYFYFFTYFHFLLEYFTFDEIDDRIRMYFMGEKKQEFLQQTLWEVKNQPYLKLHLNEKGK